MRTRIIQRSPPTLRMFANLWRERTKDIAVQKHGVNLLAISRALLKKEARVVKTQEKENTKS